MYNNNTVQPGFVAGTPDWIKPLLVQAANKYGVPTSILSAQIKQESGFNPNARGYNRDRTGNVTSTDRGIAQINDYWHPEVSGAQADNPTFAVNWMAKTMANNYKNTGSWESALSIYNTGNPTSGKVPGGYVDRVVSHLGGAYRQATELPYSVQEKQAAPSAQIAQPQLVSPQPSQTPAQPRRIPAPTVFRDILSMARQPSQPTYNRTGNVPQSVAPTPAVTPTTVASSAPTTTPVSSTPSALQQQYGVTPITVPQNPITNTA